MRNLFLPFILISSFLLLVSCSKENTEVQKVKEVSPPQTPIEFTNNGQSSHIIPLYEEVLEYTTLVKNNPSKNTKTEYSKKVVEPFQKIAAERNIDINSGYFSWFSPTTNPQQLEDNTLKLLEQQDQINDYIKESIISSAKLLSGTDKTFFVMPINPENTFTIQEMEGVAGITLSENTVLLPIDPSFTEMALKYTAAHEYNHMIVLENSERNVNGLIDPLIFEGKADSFAKMVFPDKNVPWIEPMAVESEKIVLDHIKNNIDTFDSSIYDGLLNGDSTKGIPPWSNYKIGYKITQSFLKNNPELSISELTKLEAEEIIRGSEFSKILN
jgi:uncharacterized protein YjaZ